MKAGFILIILSLLSGISLAQCASGDPGTNCSGPLTVQPPPTNANQSAITLVDLGLPLPTPAIGQYALSIGGGMLLESDNGNAYHSLVGPIGPQGSQGGTGPQGPDWSYGTYRTAGDTRACGRSRTTGACRNGCRTGGL
jgi:hypothetical protein